MYINQPGLKTKKPLKQICKGGLSCYNADSLGIIT